MLIGGTIALLVAGAIAVIVVTTRGSDEPISAAQMALKVLEKMPVIDG